MFGLVASSGIVSEPLARASREDVAKRFDAARSAPASQDDQLLCGPIHNQSDASKGVSVRRRGRRVYSRTLSLPESHSSFGRPQPQLRFGGVTGKVCRRWNGRRKIFLKRAGDLWAPTTMPLTRNMARRGRGRVATVAHSTALPETSRDCWHILSSGNRLYKGRRCANLPQKLRTRSLR